MTYIQKRRPSGSRNGTRPVAGGNTRRFSSSPRRSGGNRGFKNKSYFDLSKFINKVSITEEQDVFTPEHSFSDFAVDEKVKRAIGDKGYVLPTPIQDRAIPHVLKGHDIVGIANTGTGKTAAFLIPLIDKVVKNKNEIHL